MRYLGTPRVTANRTMKDECLTGEPRTVVSFSKAISKYLLYYNDDGMHMGIDFKTPAQMLQMLPRS
jgi:hypothetical protein